MHSSRKVLYLDTYIFFPLSASAALPSKRSSDSSIKLQHTEHQTISPRDMDPGKIVPLETACCRFSLERVLPNMASERAL